jgi:predicted molibdopterin-dependent oxidoreductase YjgC
MGEERFTFGSVFSVRALRGGVPGSAGQRGAKYRMGPGAAGASSELIIVVGANPAGSHPVLATRIKRSNKLADQKLIVADLRKNDLADRAELHIHPKPGTDLVWLSAVTKNIVDQGWEDREFLRQGTLFANAYNRRKRCGQQTDKQLS